MARWFRDRDPARGIPAVSLRSLLPEAQLRGCHDLVVSGCSQDSRRVEPGEIFAALRGERHDGHEFAPRAIERGACGAIVERELPLDGAVQVIVADSRAAHARLTRALAGDPGSRLVTIVIAGSRAARSAALGLTAILEADGHRCGRIGPDGSWTDGTRHYPGNGRWPAPELLLGLAETLAARGCTHLVVEVPASHHAATDLACLGPIAALIVPDTRPAPDLESRVAARRALKRLACQVRSGGIVAVSADDREAELIGAVNLQADRLAFGGDPLADVSATAIVGGLRGPSHLLIPDLIPELARPVRFRPLGARNARGALAAAALARGLGIDPQRIAEGLESLGEVPGRLELLASSGAFTVVREDADCETTLRGAFAELRALGSRRLLSVLSPEVARRGELARLCGMFSDLVVTGDDRREAIELGLSRAAAGDTVLVLGGSRPRPQPRSGGAVVIDDRSLVAAWFRRASSLARRSA